MSFYKIYSTKSFERDLKKLSKTGVVSIKIAKILKTMRVNPFDLSLRTHQVNTPSQGKVWSSRVTGDLRLIWEFDENMEMTIIALRLQGHDTVYN